MKRERYFPETLAERPEWFHNFATELPDAAAAMPSLDPIWVTARVSDAKNLEYASGAWLTWTRELGPRATAALEQFYFGPEAGAFALPVFTAPPPFGVLPPVEAGALRRLFDGVKVIKGSAGYTPEIGLQLRVIGEEITTVHPVPTFTTKIERGGGCECVKLRLRKYGHKGVVIQSRRGSAAWEQLAIFLGTAYLDERPLLVPTQPEIREYRLQFYDDAGPNGEFTDPQAETVAP